VNKIIRDWKNTVNERRDGWVENGGGDVEVRLGVESDVGRFNAKKTIKKILGYKMFLCLWRKGGMNGSANRS